MPSVNKVSAETSKSLFENESGDDADDGVVFGRGKQEQRIRLPSQYRGDVSGTGVSARVGMQMSSEAPPAPMRMAGQGRIRSTEDEDQNFHMRQALAKQRE